MSPFAIYFFISGIICFLEMYYWIEINKTEDFEGFRPQVNALKNVLYIIGLLFGWVLLPLEIILIVYKNVTKKSLF